MKSSMSCCEAIEPASVVLPCEDSVLVCERRSLLKVDDGLGERLPRSRSVNSKAFLPDAVLPCESTSASLHAIDATLDNLPSRCDAAPSPAELRRYIMTFKSFAKVEGTDTDLRSPHTCECERSASRVELGRVKAYTKPGDQFVPCKHRLLWW